MKIQKLSLEEAREAFCYDPESGILSWKSTRTHNARAGDQCGSVSHKDGYRVVSFKGTTYPVYHIAWLLMTGEHPTNTIDHINRNPSDNRFSNLRLADMVQQLGNRGALKKNKLGVRGVRKLKTGYDVRLGYKDKVANKYRRLCLGTFRSLEEAKAVYDAAAKEYFGEFYTAEPLSKTSALEEQ